MNESSASISPPVSSLLEQLRSLRGEVENPEPVVISNSVEASSEFVNADFGGNSQSASLDVPQAFNENVTFLPLAPQSQSDTGLTTNEIEALITKYLIQRGPSSGRAISEGIHLPLRMITECMESLRTELVVALKGSSGVGDFLYELTKMGNERGQRFLQSCSYVGPAPVPIDAYIESIHVQSIKNTPLKMEGLCKALSDLQLPQAMISRLGQALNAGRGMFLYGPPGNGKTSIAERVIAAYGQAIWIPQVISVNGDLIRLYDPRSHQAVDISYLGETKIDRRWILIERPTMVVGGELTLEQLDVRFNPATGISEAPVQLKANCGAFVIDDFGRQRTSSLDLLNRMIVPMEKNYDYLNLPSGRQLELPVEQLIIFSTNLCPKDLVDEAFLRRIPYKVEVDNPSEAEFRQLFDSLAEKMGFTPKTGVMDYLIREYYVPVNRQFRFCHPRDLLRQIHNLCEFEDRPLELSNENIDIAVGNYFSNV